MAAHRIGRRDKYRLHRTPVNAVQDHFSRRDLVTIAVRVKALYERRDGFLDVFFKHGFEFAPRHCNRNRDYPFLAASASACATSSCGLSAFRGHFGFGRFLNFISKVRAVIPTRGGAATTLG